LKLTKTSDYDIFVLVKDTRYDTEAENDVRTFTDLEEAKKELQEMCEVYRRMPRKMDGILM
jgi:predicted nucleotidyltransferase